MACRTVAIGPSGDFGAEYFGDGKLEEGADEALSIPVDVFVDPIP